MSERGQVFTLDMFFALTLTALVVSYSGLALEQARRQSEEYALRYSLERVANDAADALAKTLGRPPNWEENVERLETPGLTEENVGAVQNTLSVGKFGQLMRLLNRDNWEAPANSEAVKAVKEFFGWTEKFKIAVFDENGVRLWDIWPRWDLVPSGVENSFEVAVVRRSIVMRYGVFRAESGRIVRYAGQPKQSTHTVYFDIYPGELDALDWYIIVRTGSGDERVESAKIFVNRAPNGDYDYHFRSVDAPEQIYPNPKLPAPKFKHGGIENDARIPAQYQLHEGTNFLSVVVHSGPGGWVQIFVVAIPACTTWDRAGLALYKNPATLEVKLWR